MISRGDEGILQGFAPFLRHQRAIAGLAGNQWELSDAFTFQPSLREGL